MLIGQLSVANVCHPAHEESSNEKEKRQLGNRFPPQKEGKKELTAVRKVRVCTVANKW